MIWVCPVVAGTPAKWILVSRHKETPCHPQMNMIVLAVTGSFWDQVICPTPPNLIGQTLVVS